jgi:hypothetical protein
MRTTAEFTEKSTDRLADVLISDGVVVRWSGPRSAPFNVARRRRNQNDGARGGWIVVLLQEGDASNYSEWADIAPGAERDPRVIRYLARHGVGL